MLTLEDDKRKPILDEIAPGIRDLKSLAKWMPDLSFIGRAVKGSIDDPLHLYLMIDAAYAPSALVEELRDILERQHRLVDVQAEPPVLLENGLTGDYAGTEPSWHPTKQPPIRECATWTKYLRCYDYRVIDGLKYGEIAKRVYGSTKKRDNAERAVQRAQHLVEAAEQHHWPPRL